MSSLENYQETPTRSLLWKDNPVLVHLVGLSPLLAISTSAVMGFSLGLSTLLVFCLSSISFSAIRSHISPMWKMTVILAILAIYTTILDIALQWQFYALHRELGIYLLLIPCNMAILVRMTSYQRDSRPLEIFTDAISTGFIYLLTLLSFSLLREFAIKGAVLTDSYLWIPSRNAIESEITSLNGELFSFAVYAPPAFFLLALIIATKNYFHRKAKMRSPQIEGSVTPAPRARVTGKI